MPSTSGELARYTDVRAPVALEIANGRADEHADADERAHVALAAEVGADEAGVHRVGGDLRAVVAAGELAREQHVGELGRAVHEEAAVPAALPLEVVEVEAVAGERCARSTTR